MQETAAELVIKEKITTKDGWMGFDEFEHLALYSGDFGYYTGKNPIFGQLPTPENPSDFVTAPEISPLFGQALSYAVAQALNTTQTNEVWEFGAGTGALAAQIMAGLNAQGKQLARYCIVDVSGTLKARQRERLADAPFPVEWVDELPSCINAVVIGNEVLDAIPVKLLHRQSGQWFERGVAVDSITNEIVWQNRITELRPPCSIEGISDYLTEIHPQAHAFIRTIALKLQRGAAFFIDYGFSEREYYHPQRHMGTVMCHKHHAADTNPLSDVGNKDITAHINFTDIAVAGQKEGLHVLGYTSQGRFLFNCGLTDLLEKAPQTERIMAQKLVLEHEMGELFKVIGFVRGDWFDSLGFAHGDRTHEL